MTATTRFVRPRRRQGFTLVEVLVAMALIIFIMVILTEAFSAGIGTFRALKAQGDMQAKLRTAENLLRDDLVHYHFGDDRPLRYFNSPTTVVKWPTYPPAPDFTRTGMGYFYVQHWGTVQEGLDGNNVPSTRMHFPGDGITPAAAGTPFMCFTVNLGWPKLLAAPPPPAVQADKGFLASDFFAGRIPNLSTSVLAGEVSLRGQAGPVDYQQKDAFLSQWAEIGYFLTDTGSTAGTAAGNQTKLWSLRRRVRAVVPVPPPPGTPTTLSGATGTLNSTTRIPISEYNSRYAEVSCIPDPAGTFIYFNDLVDLYNDTSLNRMYHQANWNTALGTTQGQSTWLGDDLVMSDVISFNVRVLLGTPGTPVGDFQDPPLTDPSGFVFYDSSKWTTNQVLAVEITLRVWDAKTNLARQVTIVQDM